MQTPRIDLPSKAMSMTEEEILTLDDDATDTPMEDVQVASMGRLSEQARGALRRLGSKQGALAQVDNAFRPAKLGSPLPAPKGW